MPSDLQALLLEITTVLLSCAKLRISVACFCFSFVWMGSTSMMEEACTMRLQMGCISKAKHLDPIFVLLIFWVFN